MQTSNSLALYAWFIATLAGSHSFHLVRALFRSPPLMVPILYINGQRKSIVWKEFFSVNYIAGAAETTVRGILVALTGEQAVSNLMMLCSKSTSDILILTTVLARTPVAMSRLITAHILHSAQLSPLGWANSFCNSASVYPAVM